MPGTTKCNYVDCPRNNKNSTNLRFFNFPVSDKQRCRAWLVNSGRDDLAKLSDNQLQCKKICRNHFKFSDFTNSFCNRLIKTAVPVHYFEHKSYFDETTKNSLGSQNCPNTVPSNILQSSSTASSILVLSTSLSISGIGESTSNTITTPSTTFHSSTDVPSRTSPPLSSPLASQPNVCTVSSTAKSILSTLLTNPGFGEYTSVKSTTPTTILHSSIDSPSRTSPTLSSPLASHPKVCTSSSTSILSTLLTNSGIGELTSVKGTTPTTTFHSLFDSPSRTSSLNCQSQNRSCSPCVACSPMKKKMLSKILQQKKLLMKKRSQISYLKKKQKTSYKSDVIKLMSQLVSGDVLTFFKMQLKEKRRWSEEEKCFAMSLYFKSPSAYLHFQDKGFNLPCLRTIQRWVNIYNLQTGFTDEV